MANEVTYRTCTLCAVGRCGICDGLATIHGASGSEPEYVPCECPHWDTDPFITAGTG